MRFSRIIPAALAAISLLASEGSAQQVKYTGHVGSMQLGNPFGPGSHPFVGPYTMLNVTTNSPFDIYCIDFDHAFTGNAFNARILTFADAVNSSLSFNGVDNFTALKRALGTTTLFTSPGSIPNTTSEYFDRLRVSASIAKGFGTTQTSDWDERHFAIWGIFSGNVTPYMNDGVNDHVTILTAGINQAIGGYTAPEFRIIIDERAWDNSYTGNLEQTSITEVSTVPEPSTYALVGVGMIVMAGVARRRKGRQSSVSNTQLV